MSGSSRNVRRPVNKKGRNRHPHPFVMHLRWLLDSPAYRDLRPLARGVYMMLKRRFNGVNNGNVSLSTRQIAEELHCSKDSASAALRELEAHGFVRCSQRGSFHYKVRHAPTWILTEYELDGETATKDFMHWSPPNENAGP